MKTNSSQYSPEDVIKSFQWLGHHEHGYTELCAFHKKYKAGRENFVHNLERGFLPKIWYTKKDNQALAFVKKFYKDHTCCYGINPRPAILRNMRRYPRSAKDSDIETVVNFYLDFDIADSVEDNQQIFQLRELLNEIIQDLRKEKIKEPALAFTGNGYHLLFALPAISVDENPAIKDRLMAFRNNIYQEYRQYMKNIGAKLDNTMDLRRVAKIYGTKKPYKNYKLSKFYKKDRVEDFVLREYLFSLDMTDHGVTDIPILAPESLSKTFRDLLHNDNLVKQLWNNQGKDETADVSRSGYDFSLTRLCIKKGITDINDLAAILTLRPLGAVRKSGKGEKYVLRTIGKALYS